MSNDTKTAVSDELRIMVDSVLKMYYLTTPTAFSSLPAAQVNDEDPLCNLR